MVGSISLIKLLIPWIWRRRFDRFCF